MKICVLQPDYSTTEVDYKNYDPPRDLAHLLKGHETDHIFLNKLCTYTQLKQLKKNNYDIFVNLCEGYLDWSVPSIDVIVSLDLLNLPYTGPNAQLYDPPKELMKYVAYTCGVNTPSYILIKETNEIDNALASLQFPLFVKPAKAGDSLGIDKYSLVHSKEELINKAGTLLPDYDELMVEDYIDGREFTVLVTALAGDNKSCFVYEPVEFIFPHGMCFKTYELKTSDLHAEANILCTDVMLSEKLKNFSSKIFNAFNGVGYARLDFRMDQNGNIFFLEINFTCSVFYEQGYEGSADYILMNSPGKKEGFLKNIIDEGIFRHAQKQKKYVVKGDSVSGYGIYAAKDIQSGEVVFRGEENPHRLITKKYVEENWNKDDLENFRRYAWPLSQEVYILWDNNPREWAPQNHSCDANTHYSGLNVLAKKQIRKNDELTLDYTSFLNNEMESFICNCGTSDCRKIIQGKQENSISYLLKPI